jgi:LPXTG-motif cell wall-anchored protein
MKTSLNIFAVLLILSGCVWFLQGINILPGSFMTGQIQWAIYGGIAIVVGSGILFFANRKKNDTPQ